MIIPGIGVLPLLIIAGVAVTGFGGCMYQKGKDSRDEEVSRLTIEKQSAEASNQSLQRDIDKKNEVISRQNAEVERLESIGKSVRGLQATIRQESEVRRMAQEARLSGLDQQAKTGTESALNCPKTAAILGDLSDAVHGVTTAPAPAVAVPKPAVVPTPQPPITGPTPPRPVLPPKPVPRK